MAIKKLTDVINGTETKATTNTGIRKLSEVAKENGWEITREPSSGVTRTFENPTNNTSRTTLKNNLLEAQQELGQKTKNLIQKRQELTTKSLANKGINSVLPTKEEVNKALGTPTITENVKDTLERNKTLNATERQKTYYDTTIEVNKMPEVQPYIKETNKAISNRNKALYELNKYDVENTNVNTYDKTVRRVFDAIKSNLGAFDKGKTVILDENGNETYVPTKTSMWNQKVSNSYKNEITKFLGDVVYQGSKIGSATLLNAAVPGAGTGLYWSSMAADNYQDAKVDGYDDKSAALYSMIDTGLEFLTGKLLGSATKGLTGGKSSEVSKALKSWIKPLIKSNWMQNFIANATSEGLEEFVQEYLGEINKSITLDKDFSLNKLKDIILSAETLKNAGYSGFVGAATGGLLGGNVDTDETSIETNNINKNKNSNISSNINENTNLEEQNIENNTNTNINEEITQNVAENVSENVSQEDIQTQIEETNNQIKELQEKREKTTEKAQQTKLDNQISILEEKIENLTKEIQNNTQNVKQNNNSNETKIIEQSNNTINKQELSNDNSFNLKQQQFDIISKTNPMNDDYHTGIRNANEIKTLQEAIQDSDYDGYDAINPDLTKQDILDAIDKGTIEVYSSYPIEQGVFVTPSKMEAESYSGNGKVYSKVVPIQDVAWIDPTQGQYAKVNNNSINLGNDLPLPTINKALDSLSIDNNRTSTFSNNLLTFTEQEKASILRADNNVIVDTKEELQNYVLEAINNNKSNKNIYLGVLPNTTIENITNKVTDISNENRENLFNKNKEYQLAVNQEEIRHLYKESLTVDDVVNFVDSLDELIANFDTVRFSIYSKNQKALRFKKKMNDGTHIALEILSKQRGTMRSQTLFLDKADFIANKKRSISPTFDELNNSPNKTSEMDGGLTPYIDNSITNNSKSQIRGVLPTNSNMQKVEKNTTLPTENLTRAQVRKNVIAENREQAKFYTQNSSNWKDKSLISHKTNTMKRNLRSMMPQSEADMIYKEYFQPISKNNALMEKEITKYNEKLKSLDLNKNESIAVQMLGEKKYNPDTKLTDKEVSDFIQKKKLDYNKISRSVEVFRQTYDELFAKVNEVLKENGLQEIEYRKGYFPHFTEQHGKTIIGKMAEKLGWKFKDNKLPTDIAGMTEFFTPNKKWVAFTQHRTGDYTDYNALKGFDNYVRGAMNIIHHTEDIQKLRALENEIRYKHSEKGLQKEIDKINDNEELSLEEKQELIDNKYKDYNNELANFVTNLRDYTNNIAGKKSALDRSVENLMGRKTYTVMDNVNSRVSANMVAANLSSAFTNFIPLTQAWSQISTKNMLKAAAQTTSNSINNDGFIDKSTYLTNRINKADNLYKTTLEKVGEKLTGVFEGIDSVTSQIIVRGKYLENLENGMNETEALNNADEFAKDVMAGRSLGDQPTIFNSKSPITKLFTAFQLEVNNQYGYMFKDLPKDLKDKGIKTLAMAFFKMFIGAWLYNKAAETITGRKSAFSPIDIVEESYDAVTNDNLTFAKKVENLSKNVAQELPFISGLAGGGRLPIQGAIPYDNPFSSVLDTISDVGTALGRDESKSKTAINNLKKEWSKPLFYILPPFGGGQTKKTIEGLGMYANETPGSYTASGKLRFPAKTDVASVLQNALFGQYSSKEAREYFDSNATPLSEKQQKEFKDLDVPIETYRSIRKGLSQYTKKKDKIEYINKLKGINWKQKQILINNL